MINGIRNGIVGEDLYGQWCLVKIKRFPSSTEDDLSHHILVVRKKHTNMIHIGTNDAPSSTSKEIQDNLLKLKSLVKKSYRNIKFGYQPLR